jgi:filamentous hemagglutinin
MAASEGYDYRFKQKSKGGLFGTSRKESIIASSSIPVVSALTAGDRVIVEAGKGGAGDLTVTGSRVESGGDTYLGAESGIVIMPVRVESYSKVESEESGFMGTGSMKLDESQASVNVRSEIAAGGKVVLESGGDLVLQSARLSSGAETQITARNGAVGMLAAKDFFYERHVESETGYFSWSSSDKGAQDEIVQHTEIASGTSLQIATSGGVVVEYKETGDVRQDIGQLAQAPGLAWMGELVQRDDVDWRAVQEVHDTWKEEQSGFGGPGVQLVSLAVAVALTATGIGSAFATWATGINTATGAAAATAATSGAAAGAAGATVAGATTAASLTATQLAIHSAVAAGFNALVTQASVQLIGNQGDIGATLEALASMDTVRSLATAMLTAGLTSGLMDAAGVANDPGLLSQAEDMTEFMDILTVELGRTVIRASVSAGVNTAINGGDLGQNLVNSLRTAAVITLGAQVAGEIGLATREGDLNYVANKIAHAALGAAMGEALSGDAAAGAIGAVVGEMAAEAFVQRFVFGQLENPEALKNLTDAEALQLQADLARLESTGVDMAKLAAGIAAAVAERDIDTAATTGGNAAKNNELVTISIALELMDKGLQAYDVFRLAKAIEAGDTDEAAEISAEIALGTATDAIPGNVVVIKIVSAVKKFGLVGLSAKILGKFGDEAVGAGKIGQKSFDFVDLTDPKARKHILEGDATGGGHKYGAGMPGKTQFPEDWSDEKIIHVISEISTDNSLTWSSPSKNGYITAVKRVDGINVKVVVDPKLKRIVTGFPLK